MCRLHTECASKQLIFRVVHFPFLFYTHSGFSSDFPFLLSEFCARALLTHFFLFLRCCRFFFGGGECDAFVIEFMWSSRACASHFIRYLDSLSCTRSVYSLWLLCVPRCQSDNSNCVQQHTTWRSRCLFVRCCLSLSLFFLATIWAYFKFRKIEIIVEVLWKSVTENAHLFIRMRFSGAPNWL